MQLQKTSAWRNLFIFKALSEPFFPYKPHTQTFLTFQSKWAQRKNFVLIIIQLSEVGIQPSSELFELLIQMSSLFIHVTNFKITITNLNSKFYIYYLKYWHFLNNWVFNFLEERSSTICPSSPDNWEWKTQIKKFDLVYRITRPFIKHNLRFRMQGPWIIYYMLKCLAKYPTDFHEISPAEESSLIIVEFEHHYTMLYCLSKFYYHRGFNWP